MELEQSPALCGKHNLSNQRIWFLPLNSNEWGKFNNRISCPVLNHYWSIPWLSLGGHCGWSPKADQWSFFFFFFFISPVLRARYQDGVSIAKAAVIFISSNRHGQFGPREAENMHIFIWVWYSFPLPTNFTHRHHSPCILIISQIVKRIMNIFLCHIPFFSSSSLLLSFGHILREASKMAVINSSSPHWIARISPLGDATVAQMQVPVDPSFLHPPSKGS